MKLEDFPMEISAMDEAVVNKTGYTCARKAAELNLSYIRSYVEILCGCHSCSVMDPFEADDIRRTNHNTIAAAFSIPRKLVQKAADTVTPREDAYTLYHRKRNFLDDSWEDFSNLNFVIQKFIERIVELRYEFYIEGKWQEFVERIANTWVEKDFDDLKGIPNMVNDNGEKNGF